MTTWLHWIDLLGVAVFAVSGTLMAHKKDMDGFGVVVLASVTAIGGGSLRDVLLNQPVFWVQQPDYLYAILAAAFGTIWWLNSQRSLHLSALLVADAIGLAFFNIMGLQKALSLDTGPFIAIVMGTMTGVFGGLIRDVICQEIPLVLRGQLYATTCIFGGIVYVTADSLGLSPMVCFALGVICTLGLRLLAMRRDWHWPIFKQPTD